MRDFSVIAIFERKFFYMSEEIEIKDEVLDLKVTETYDENQIQVLEGLEAVRKRPGMYIGSTSARGLHHLVYEIVDNSIDEALAGYCTHIEVTIEQGDIIRVTRQRPRHSLRHPSADGHSDARGRSDCAARRRQVRRLAATRSPAVCTASARRS